MVGPNKVRGLEKNGKINKREGAFIRHLGVVDLSQIQFEPVCPFTLDLIHSYPDRYWLQIGLAIQTLLASFPKVDAFRFHVETLLGVQES